MKIGTVTISDPQLPIEFEDYKPTLEFEFESNDVQIAEADTRNRTSFKFVWDGTRALRHSEWKPLVDFLKANAGKSFSVVFPYTEEVLENMYRIGSKINSSVIIPNMPAKGIEGMYKLELQIGEL